MFFFTEIELRGLSPNFHIHVPVSDLYIPTISLNILQQKYVDRSWEYKNRAQTHKFGLRPRNSCSGNS
jgi:hypothetical protein